MTASVDNIDATVWGWRYWAKLGRPFELTVVVHGESAETAGDALGGPLSVRSDQLIGGGVHGVVWQVETLLETPRLAISALMVVPRLRLLSLHRHNRVWTDTSPLEAVMEVLEASGLSSADVELRLETEPPVEDHICQIDETDLAFVQRWLERLGIFYWFDHGGDADKLVLCDDLARCDRNRGAVRYHPGSGRDTSAGEHLRRFALRRGRSSEGVTVRDNDAQRPRLTLEAAAEVDSRGEGTVVDHPGRALEQGKLDHQAEIRARQRASVTRWAHAAGQVTGLDAGVAFELAGHAVGSMNRGYVCQAIEQRYVHAALDAEMAALTGLSSHWRDWLHGKQPGPGSDEAPEEKTLDAELTALPDDVAFAPAPSVAWPRIEGIRRAVVDGATNSDYAQLDDHGRYLVRFRFDEAETPAGKASARLRMMQPHAGSPEGMHFPLRKGTEVAVTFLGGDPDRPLISGAIPDAHHPSVVTSENATRNVIHTGGDNRLEMEDERDVEWIHLSTPEAHSFLHLGEPHDSATHHLMLNTDDDCLFDFGASQDISVGGDLTEDVGGAVTEDYGGQQSSTILGTQKTHVTGAVTETYNAGHMNVVAGAVTEDYTSSHTSMVGGGRVELFGATQETKVGGAVKHVIHGPHTRTVGGSSTNLIGGAYTRKAPGGAILSYPSSHMRTAATVDSKIDALTWLLPSGATTAAGSFTIAIPAENWWSALDFRCTAFLIEAIGAVALAFGTKVAATGLAVDAYQAKADAGGVALVLTPLALESGGGHSKTYAAAQVNESGFKWLP